MSDTPITEGMMERAAQHLLSKPPTTVEGAVITFMDVVTDEVIALELRLKAVEAECLEQCRRLAMGGEREARLMALNAALQRQVEELQDAFENAVTAREKAEAKNAALRGLLERAKGHVLDAIDAARKS